MNKFWYVLHSKPNKEEFLTGQLESRNIEYYFPYLNVKPVNPRSRKRRPYFTGYLFIQADLDKQNEVTFERIPGVIGLVYIGGEAASIPDPILQAIRVKVDELNSGKKVLSNLWNKGDHVNIHTGPFEGYEAIFDTGISGTERVRILLSLLQGRKLKVELPMDHLSLKKTPSISR